MVLLVLLVSSPSFTVDVLTSYTTALTTHPLETKAFTAGTLALAGDATAQLSQKLPYDPKRALGFTTFGATYSGAFQHSLFPFLIEHCQGNMLAGLATVMSLTPPLGLASAAERTLANQLICIPFLYYPLFFALTGAVQGLAIEGSIQRGRESWAPLVQRNLLFWLPIQFCQFAYVPIEWQVPYVCSAGLVWNIILSSLAGSAATGRDVDDTEADLMCALEGCVVVENEKGDQAQAEFEPEREPATAVLR